VHQCRPRTTGDIALDDVVRRKADGLVVGRVVELRRALGGSGWDVAVKRVGSVRSFWWGHEALEVVPADEQREEAS
jgi:hypothetical protein